MLCTTKGSVVSLCLLQYHAIRLLLHLCCIFLLQLLEAVDALPACQVCLMEHEHLLMRRQKIGMAFVLSARVESMFITMMNLSHSSISSSQNVYKFKSGVMDSYFDLTVGGQRVRTKGLLSDMFRNQSPFAVGLHVPHHLKDLYYATEDKLGQEHMSYCLLQAIFFYHLLHRVAQ